ncbi:molybdopterin-guanine dinucleotide biosynthesis protein B [Deferrisoma camini]|uniref:molybdopterin-guanine dinucleotide biosynthesis protein B n=1 Tax=Deferrisoma camini TaxID=1035120 RepID=UPI00046C9B73|nr:molybdopterin-guanine dinucleotide biosynthesis protein B [Deferrisoma camini]
MRDIRTALVMVDAGDERWSWELQGEPLVHRVHRILEAFFDEVLLVTPEPGPFQAMGYKTLADERPDAGLLGAIATGLKHIPSHYAAVVGADMPFLHPRVLRHLYTLRSGWDVVVPRGPRGFEPLCAVYSKACVAPMEERIARGNLKVLDFISDVRTRIVNGEDLLALDPQGLTFRNVSSRTDLDECRLYLARLRGYGPPAVSFVAKSGTGKTTLLEKVIAELTRRGYRVGTIKHDAHRFEIDHEGKDSWRLTRAGASPMVISSAEKLAMVHPNARGEMTLEEIIYRFMTEADIVLTEGYKTGGLPKIEVHRSARSPELLCAAPDGTLRDHRLIAVVSDHPWNLPVPVLPLDHPGPVCDFLEERYLAGA